MYMRPEMCQGRLCCTNRTHLANLCFTSPSNTFGERHRPKHLSTGEQQAALSQSSHVSNTSEIYVYSEWHGSRRFEVMKFAQVYRSETLHDLISDGWSWHLHNIYDRNAHGMHLSIRLMFCSHTTCTHTKQHSKAKGVDLWVRFALYEQSCCTSIYNKSRDNRFFFGLSPRGVWWNNKQVNMRLFKSKLKLIILYDQRWIKSVDSPQSGKCGKPQRERGHAGGRTRSLINRVFNVLGGGRPSLAYSPFARLFIL